MKKFLFAGIFALLAVAGQAQTEPATHTIGESFGGGIVIYVTPNGQHGIVAETKDLYTSITARELQFAGMVGVQFKNGGVHDFSDPKYHSEQGQNFLDWRLPSFFELQAMLSNKIALQDNLKGPYGFLSLPAMVQSNEGIFHTQLLLYDEKTGNVSWSASTFGPSKFSLRLVRSF